MKNSERNMYLTSLSGERMAPKTHGRIAFRGVIDTLEAEVIEAQVLADGRGEKELCANLGEVLEFLRAIMAAEVKQTPLPPLPLFGMDLEEIHRRIKTESCRDKDEITGKAVALPSYTQGPSAVRLNTLRAKVREAELLAIRVFGSSANTEESESVHGEDIILALNRLSSALWWLYCRDINPKIISACASM